VEFLFSTKQSLSSISAKRNLKGRMLLYEKILLK